MLIYGRRQHNIVKLLSSNLKKKEKKALLVDFPGGPVAETLYSQCKRSGFDPWSGISEFICCS